MAEPPDLEMMQLFVRTEFSGAAAKLRIVVTVADREEARRIDAELTRICTELRLKHGFGRKKEDRK